MPTTTARQPRGVICHIGGSCTGASSLAWRMVPPAGSGGVARIERSDSEVAQLDEPYGTGTVNEAARRQPAAPSPPAQTARCEPATTKVSTSVPMSDTALAPRGAGGSVTQEPPG